MTRSLLLRIGTILPMLALSCSHLQIQHLLRSSPDDWAMYGGDIGRTNSVKSNVHPPFTVEWEYDATAGFSSYPAAIVDSHVVVGNLQGEIHFVDVKTGKGRGAHDFGSAVGGTPVVTGEMVYVPLAHGEGSLVAYNMYHGNIDWTANLGDIESSPLLIDQQLLVTSVHGTLYNIDRQTGIIVWKYAIPPATRSTAIHTSPASDSSVVVFGCDNGNLYAVDLQDGKLRWSASTDAAILASPSIDHGKVFVGSTDTRYYAFDIHTGKLLWKKQLDAKIYGSQAVHGERIFVGTSGRTLYCLREQDGAVIWKDSTDGIISSAPIVAGEVVYCGNLGKTLTAYSAAQGEVLWKFLAQGRIKSTPVVWGQYLFILAEDHSVIALKSGPGT